MTDTTTIEDHDDESAGTAAIIESVFDMLDSEPNHILAMTRSVFAIDEIAMIVSEHMDTGDARIVIRDIHRALMTHGIMETRKPMPAEIADPDWWGHAEGITSDMDIVTESDDYMEAVGALEGALGMGEEAETMQ